MFDRIRKAVAAVLLVSAVASGVRQSTAADVGDIAGNLVSWSYF